MLLCFLQRFCTYAFNKSVRRTAHTTYTVSAGKCNDSLRLVGHFQAVLIEKQLPGQSPVSDAADLHNTCMQREIFYTCIMHVKWKYENKTSVYVYQILSIRAQSSVKSSVKLTGLPMVENNLSHRIE